VRGMTDTAGERGETDLADLQSRIEPAVFGYLGRGGAWPRRPDRRAGAM